MLALLLLVGVPLAIFLGRGAKTEVSQDSVKKGPIKEELILSGEVSATYYAKLSFETSGKIIYVGVKEGEEVKKGRLLTKLDTTILNSAYQQALSALRTKEATVANVHDQVKDHSADETYAQKDARTTAEAAKDSAYESMIQAKRSLDGASLYTPFNGIVTYIANQFIGINTIPSQTQVEIIDPESMYFSVSADQDEVIKIFPGQKVDIVLDSFGDKTFSGIVETVAFAPRSLDSGSSYPIKVEFEGVDLSASRFKIAMSGDAKFILEEKTDAFYVPANYVKTDKSGKYLKLDAKKKKLYIETGLENEDYIEIKGDISIGLPVYD